jgi:hypothetical protein
LFGFDRGEFDSAWPGHCVAQDTFYVGTLKGVGRVYQQTAIDTYAKVAFAKLYDRKTTLTSGDLFNDRVSGLCRSRADRAHARREDSNGRGGRDDFPSALR